jgi:hypothetical protein
MATWGMEFADMCQQTICWEAQVANVRDSFGKPTYAAVKQFLGRRTYKVARVAGFSRAVKGEGAEFVSESQIWIVGTLDGSAFTPPVVNYEDRVYVSGDVVYPPVINVEMPPDETGLAQFTKVYLGNANG